MWMNLAEAQRLKGNVTACMSYLFLSLWKEPMNMGAFKQLVAVLDSQGQQPLASALIQSVLGHWAKDSAMVASHHDELAGVLVHHALELHRAAQSPGSPVVCDTLASAVNISPDHPTARLKLSACLEEMGQLDESIAHYHAAVHSLHRRRRAATSSPPLPSFPASPSARLAPSAPRLVIYCDEYGQTWWPGWGPHSLISGGLGGSEEAVVFLSRALVRQGWNVTVFLEPAIGGTDEHGVRWEHLGEFDLSLDFDVFVAWRYHISALLMTSIPLAHTDSFAYPPLLHTLTAHPGPCPGRGRFCVT
jgi:hypothetical protein